MEQHILAYDLETASADELHSYGPGFVRLCGWQWLDLEGNPVGPVETSTDADRLIEQINAARMVTAHNGVDFDNMALAKWYGVDYEALCAKTMDTLITEKHLHPVAARGAQANGYYTLGATATRYGADGKDTVDFDGKVAVYRRVFGDKKADQMVRTRDRAAMKAVARGKQPTAFKPITMLDCLKAVYGGYDKIPADDPDYVRYLVKDVYCQAAVYRAQRAALKDETAASRVYVRGEHGTQAAMGMATLAGMRLNMDFTMRKYAEGQARLEAGKQRLHERYGMPLEGKQPHKTDPGKAAFKRALTANGIGEAWLRRHWPMNDDGSLSMSKDTLDHMIEWFGKAPDGRLDAAVELCSTIKALNGERTVYGTFLHHMVDGRVHPTIRPDQASGRWSMKDPGATVLGKNGGKAVERNMVLPDTDGEVLVAIDADQVDARVIAAECQDPAYMALFEPGKDLHSEVAWLIWDDAKDHGTDCHQHDPGHCDTARKCHCDKRNTGKKCGHGFSYGLGPNGMVRQTGLPIETCNRFIAGFTAAFPRLAEWKEEIRQAAGILGFDEEPPIDDTFRILHTWAGRPVRVERKRAYTQGCALVGQGGTRDVMAYVVRHLPAEYRRRIRAVIHDEFLFSIPGGPDAQERAQALADGMAFEINGVKITFGCSRVAKTWAGCYGEDYELAV